MRCVCTEPSSAESCYSHHMAVGLLEQSSPQLIGGDGSEVGHATCPESRWSRADGRAGRAGAHGQFSGRSQVQLEPACSQGAGWEGAREAMESWPGQRSAPASLGSGGKTQPQGCRGHEALVMAQGLALPGLTNLWLHLQSASF